MFRQLLLLPETEKLVSPHSPGQGPGLREQQQREGHMCKASGPGGFWEGNDKGCGASRHLSAVWEDRWPGECRVELPSVQRQHIETAGGGGIGVGPLGIHQA